MKRRCFGILALFLCAALFLGGCAAGSKGEVTSQSLSEPMEAANSAAPMPEAPSTDAADLEETGGMNSAAGLLDRPDMAESSDKIVYSAWVELETLRFEESVDAVYKLIEDQEGFLERSDISGRDYSSQFYGYKNYRQASFTIRVPKDHFSDVMGSMDQIGNVTYTSTEAQNITSQFKDSESRLAMYRAEEERLLDMLEQANTVEEMIQVESRMSEVQYNIESLTSQLKDWQKQVDYSTVSLTVSEVEQLSEEVPVQRSYWEQVGDSLKSVLVGIGSFFKDFLRILIAALPVLLICGVLAGIVLAIVFSARRARRKRRAEKAATQESQSPASEQDKE